MLFRIKNLRASTIIGINAWEREQKQDVIINIEAEFDGETAAHSDDIEDTVNYRSITKHVLQMVDESRHGLLEALAADILEIVMADRRVQRGTVEVDKPHALRFADSVSIICSTRRKS